jgi:hypothetical protein
MRKVLMEKMPVLSSRIQRRLGSGDGEVGPQVQTPPDGGIDSAWTWEDAESRLSAAYEKNGFSGWTEAVLKELDAEAERERLTNGL